VSIIRRIERLERSGDDNRGCGDGCPPVWGRIMQQVGPDGVPVVRQVLGSDQPCPRCGRPAEQVEDFLEIVIRSREEYLASKARFG
jgi:hypothetical protein